MVHNDSEDEVEAPQPPHPGSWEQPTTQVHTEFVLENLQPDHYAVFDAGDVCVVVRRGAELSVSVRADGRWQQDVAFGAPGPAAQVATGWLGRHLRCRVHVDFRPEQ